MEPTDKIAFLTFIEKIVFSGTEPIDRQTSTGAGDWVWDSDSYDDEFEKGTLVIDQ